MGKDQLSPIKMKENFIAWMKVSVAVAVVRCAPPDVKGKEYAETLAKMYQEIQYQWKTKYQKAEGEILHLKQQMILTNTQESDVTESQPLFPTPPCSGEQNVPKPTLPLSHEELHKNTTFLQSIINIQRSASKNSDVNMLHSVTSKTLHLCVQVVREMLLVDRPLVSISNMKWSLQCIVTLLDNRRFNQDTGLKNQVNGIIDDLIQKMLSTNGLDKESLAIKQNLETLLTCFAKTKSFSLLATILDCLIGEIEKFCNLLRHCCSGGDVVDIVQYENMYHIVATLDACLQSGKLLLITPSGIELVEHIQERLDDALLHLTEKYPLVAHALWRVGAVMQMVIKST